MRGDCADAADCRIKAAHTTHKHAAGRRPGAGQPAEQGQAKKVESRLEAGGRQPHGAPCRSAAGANLKAGAFGMQAAMQAALTYCSRLVGWLGFCRFLWRWLLASVCNVQDVLFFWRLVRLAAGSRGWRLLLASVRRPDTGVHAFVAPNY
jgi:hypothetical protein